MKKFLIPASFLWAATCLVVGVLMVSFSVYEYSFRSQARPIQKSRVVQQGQLRNSSRQLEDKNQTITIVTIGTDSAASRAVEADSVQTKVTVN